MEAAALKGVAAAVLIAGCAAGLSWFVHHEREIGRTEVRAQIASEAAAEGMRNAKETLRRLDQQQEAQRAHDEDLARTLADRDRARVAAVRLRQRVDELVAATCGAAGDPATARNGQAACNPARVLAELQRRADERAGILADYADRARIAGQQCERAYDSLSKPATPK